MKRYLKLIGMLVLIIMALMVMASCGGNTGYMKEPIRNFKMYIENDGGNELYFDEYKDYDMISSIDSRGDTWEITGNYFETTTSFKANVEHGDDICVELTGAEGVAIELVSKDTIEYEFEMKLVPDRKLDIYDGMFKILIEAEIEEPITSTINHELPFYYYGDDEVIFISNINGISAKKAYGERGKQ